MTTPQDPADLASELVPGDVKHGGGVEVSTDDGATWEPLDVDEDSAAMQQLPPHPDTFEGEPGVLYRRTA